MDEARSRRLLDLGPDAGPSELEQAYQRLRHLYLEEDSPLFAPAMEEFSTEARDEALAELEAAYRTLVPRCAAEARPRPRAAVAPDELPGNGAGLKRVREAAGWSVDHLSRQTHLRPECIDALEAEAFEALPRAAVNVRGFLGAYVAELGLPVDPVVTAYMGRYLAWQARQPKGR